MRILKEIQIKSIKFVIQAATTNKNSFLKEGIIIPVFDYISKSYSNIIKSPQNLSQFLYQNSKLQNSVVAKLKD